MTIKHKKLGAAIDEMVNGGFGFHPAWKNIIESIDNLDIRGLRENISVNENLVIQEYCGPKPR